ncbi:hypothetical protein ABLE93_14730 [Xanthobacter sp. KR7-65]|uniref:hypothetical protein n=1 Tax=Xanthobacter sp. KR7-65 TaxID=3156612 RepID=UPI0032B51D8C
MARNKDKPAPIIEPRCLTLQQAADYCALTPGGFAAWQKQGLVPGPIPGTKRWDRKALDAALDKASGLQQPVVVNEDDPWEVWRREKAAREAAKTRGGQAEPSAAAKRRSRTAAHCPG